MRDILDYLYLNYRRVTPLDINKNCITTWKPYNSINSNKTLYKQIDNGKIFATEAISPYTLQQIVNIAEAAIIATKLYKIDYQKWKAKLPNIQTWLNFKAHFSTAYTRVK